MKKLFFIFFLLASNPIFASKNNPFHTSVTEIVFNEKEQLWEVSIRLFQDDLEAGLSAFQGKKFQFQANVDVQNSLLVDVFPDQANLLHLARLDKKKSFLFKKDTCVILLE